MQEKRNPTQQNNDGSDPANQSKSSREKTDPQRTELKGFVDPSEDLEPTLSDGTKAPEKAEEENSENQDGR